MMQPQAYLLTASTELERLRLQARVFESATGEMLDAIGVQPGWHCLDVACGAMGIVGPLAHRAGPTGRVVGADVEPKMVAAAQAYLNEEHLPGPDDAPIELIQDDAYASALPAASFDLTHVRFLFAPVGRDAELLPALVRVTKTGGVVAVQEPESRSWSVYPQSPAFDRLKAAILEAFRQGGGDFDAGRRLYEMLTQGGLADVRVRAVVVALPPGHPYLRVPIQFATSLRPRLLAGGLFTEDELDATIAELEAHLARPDVTGLTFTVMQVWGRVLT
jgi:ubiquinone/menaquinone biosynthesis C-methylase UbiE